MFTSKQQATLHAYARNCINAKLDLPPTPVDLRDSLFQKKSGLFVTLTLNGQLRGCIGSLAAFETITDGIKHHAVNAAFHDNRFSPVTAEELDDIKIEISVLTEPVPLHFTDSQNLLEKLQPGDDGVTLRHGIKFATFLPQVWQQLPEPEQFLNHLAIKAGLAIDGWRHKDVLIEIYSVIKF